MEIEFADSDYDRLEIDGSFSAGFAPAVVNGVPVATKCILPIRVVEQAPASSFALN